MFLFILFCIFVYNIYLLMDSAEEKKIHFSINTFKKPKSMSKLKIVKIMDIKENIKEVQVMSFQKI